MNIIEIIDKKRLKKVLTKKEIAWIIKAYMNKEIKDYQMSALLMAITINGMTEKETLFFTDALIKSGERFNSNELLVDKHSTGGVGDKTTLIIAPIVAAAGLKMVKMSGRGLGHTGGTIDKLESIAGFRVELNKGEIKKALQDVNVCLVSSQKDITPADKRLYQLRDVTATTNSIPLIASSIMSKKIASGAKIIVIDLKVGNGAFIKNKKDAFILAKIMKKIGQFYHVKTICVISKMTQPIGYNVGNGLEVIEALDFLNGKYEKDLYQLVVTLASILIKEKLNISKNKAEEIVKEIIKSKRALNYFENIVKNQHGDINQIELSSKMQFIPSPKTGYIKEIDAKKIGELAKELGGGRNQIEDQIDYSVGFVFHKKVGDYVKQGDKLITVYYNAKDLSILEILNCFSFGENVKQMNIIEKII